MVFTVTNSTILAVGAHPDDIEIGAGGTLAAQAAAGNRVVMLVLTRGQAGPDGETFVRVAEQERAAKEIGAELMFGPFMDCSVGPLRLVIEFIEGVIEQINPQVVMTHYANDAHQDHRMTAKATISASRNVPSILRWASPTSIDFTPNMFVDVSEFMDVKMRSIAAHASQVAKSDRVDVSAISAMARYRGSQVRVQYAEAFMPLRALMATRVSRVPQPRDALVTPEHLVDLRTGSLR